MSFHQNNEFQSKILCLDFVFFCGQTSFPTLNKVHGFSAFQCIFKIVHMHLPDGGPFDLVSCSRCREEIVQFR